MNEMTFDTRAVAKTLREAGFEDRQAEAVAEAVRNAVVASCFRGGSRDTLAMKAELRVDNARREARFYRALWLRSLWISCGVIAGIGFAAAGFIAAAVKLP